MKFLSMISVAATFVFSVNVSAAHWCEAYIDSVTPGANGITIVATSSYDGTMLDVLTKDYDDDNFGPIYLRALSAQRNRNLVKVYPVEAKGEDDGARCKDGIADYLRTMTLVN